MSEQGDIMETLISINSAINNFVWGIPAMVCIPGIGLYLSIRTGSMAHASADVNHPVRQGFFGIFEVFVDTIERILIYPLLFFPLMC